MTDFGIEAQRAAEAHLAACQEAFWDYESGEMQGEEDGSPASAPFCNCDTCIVREVLFAAWPIMQQEAQDEIDQLRGALKDLLPWAGKQTFVNDAVWVRARELAADHVDPEQEDQHQSGGDDRQHDVLP